jgi:hypothetical protein
MQHRKSEDLTDTHNRLQNIIEIYNEEMSATSVSVAFD